MTMLEDRWKIISRAIFKEEIGSMAEYSSWLTEFTEPITHRKSSVSGKDVICAPTEYCKKARWIAHDEIDFKGPLEPLDINEVKDIDSIVEAISERWYYAGNIVFGKSEDIERSSNINDSFHIYETARFGNSKYIAYCTIGRSNEACFGCNVVEESAGCIKCHRSFRNKQSFELWMSQNCFECNYSFGLNNCINCLFSFNVQNKKYTIGNLELDADKYNKIRSKLLSEMVEELKLRKRLPSLLDIVKKSKKEKNEIHLSSHNKDRKNPGDMTNIETAFSQTSSILFGKKLEGIDQYANWLARNTRMVEKCSSAFSNKPLFLSPYANYSKLPRDRLLNLDEAMQYGLSISLTKNDLEELNWRSAYKKLGKLAFFNIEMKEGTNLNLIESVISVDSAHCYRSSVTEYSKYCAYSFWPRSSQYLFGCDSPFDSNFCINCYSCTGLSRCFEIDCCGYCSDCFFCHNCENVHESMFSFNTKNKRNIIGNAQYTPKKYESIKNSILSQITAELEGNKHLKWDIYNIGGYGKETNHLDS